MEKVKAPSSPPDTAERAFFIPSLPRAPMQVPGQVPTEPKAIPNIRPPVITPRFMDLTWRCDISRIPVIPDMARSILEKPMAKRIIFARVRSSRRSIFNIFLNPVAPT